jgi:hypothetical protein
VPGQRVDGAFGELDRDRLVEAACDDREAPAVADGLSDELCHLVRSFL